MTQALYAHMNNKIKKKKIGPLIRERQARLKHFSVLSLDKKE
jgi:hypothetical protein